MSVTYADVEAAAGRIAGIAHRTPVLTSRTADARTGASLFFKAEPLQRAGAFKFRGACNAIAALSPEQRQRGVLAFSSGNHAQAIAYAGALQQVPTVIVMPHDAPAIKVAATRGYGAEIVTYDRYKEDREEVSRRLAEARGLSVIPPYDHPDVIAGQGTAVKELIEEVGPLDVLLVCLGGGGLLAGSCLAAGPCRLRSRSGASSPRPAMTASNPSPRARWSASRSRSRSPTGRSPRISASTPSRSSGARPPAS